MDPSPTPNTSPNPNPTPNQASSSSLSRRSVRTARAPAQWRPTLGVASLLWDCGATAGGGCTGRRCVT